MPVPNQKLFYPSVGFATPLSRTQTFRDQAVGISITVKRYDLVRDYHTNQSALN